MRGNLISKIIVQHKRTEGHKVFPNADLQTTRENTTEIALPTSTERKTKDCSQGNWQKKMKIKKFKLPGIN